MGRFEVVQTRNDRDRDGPGFLNFGNLQYIDAATLCLALSNPISGTKLTQPPSNNATNPHGIQWHGGRQAASREKRRCTLHRHHHLGLEKGTIGKRRVAQLQTNIYILSIGEPALDSGGLVAHRHWRRHCSGNTAVANYGGRRTDIDRRGLCRTTQIKRGTITQLPDRKKQQISLSLPLSPSLSQLLPPNPLPHTMRVSVHKGRLHADHADRQELG